MMCMRTSKSIYACIHVCINKNFLIMLSTQNRFRIALVSCPALCVQERGLDTRLETRMAYCLLFMADLAHILKLIYYLN